MIIKIKVHPSSSRQKIKKIDEWSYEVWLKKKPENNSANKELLKFLKNYFKKEVRIKSGFKSKRKIIEID